MKYQASGLAISYNKFLVKAGAMGHGGWISSVNKDLVEKYPARLSLSRMPIGEFANGVGDDLEAADRLGREFDPIIGQVGRHGFAAQDRVGLRGGKGPEPFEVVFIGTAPDFQLGGRKNKGADVDDAGETYIPDRDGLPVIQ